MKQPDRKRPTDQEKNFAWSIAPTRSGSDQDKVRNCHCCCGREIKRSHYGKRSSKYGWEMDHDVPHSMGGENSIFNFRALHWRCNVGKGKDLNYTSLEPLVLVPGPSKSKNIMKTRKKNIIKRRKKMSKK